MVKHVNFNFAKGGPQETSAKSWSNQATRPCKAILHVECQLIREMLRLQHFYNKSQVVSCYWFKFETNTKIIFALTITTSNNLPLRICCKNVVDISFLN